ncbi:MAG: DNA methyltransferase [Paludibacteraceae bacterium]
MPVTIYGIQQELFPVSIDSRVQGIVDPNDNSNTDVFDGFFTIKEAAQWASDYLHRNVSNANISYLINYGKIKKYSRNGTVVVMKEELEEYYQSYHAKRQIEWKDKLGNDLNWALSFDNLLERETTKHVHRLHPYKGKYIPQLVEYFLDGHTDEFKNDVYFRAGDIVLDPFSGSGTTLVEANELAINAIGIDISSFNAMIANSKLAQVNFYELSQYISQITTKLKGYIADSKVTEFEEKLLQKLNEFNNIHFPVPDYKYKVARKEIDPNTYGKEKAQAFLPVYNQLVEEYGIQLKQEKQETFLDKWFTQQIRNEIEFVYSQIALIQDKKIHDLLCIILSRTMRSCRATTHADLGTLKDAVTTTYYCSKHGKICKPLFSILKWWETYSKDTIQRLQEFSKLRTDTFQQCLVGDSRNIDIFKEIDNINPIFGQQLREKKIKGIFSSPPYVGLIDYHEQHAYAYDLFLLPRHDEQEIGPLFKGQKLEAQHSYVEGIAAVLNNSKRFLAEDYDIFLVANDKYNLYPKIAEAANMRIVEQIKRPVLNRTERDKGAYCEIIFHLKRL